MVVRKIIFVLITLFTSVSCGSENKKYTDFINIEFDVDNNLLSEPPEKIDDNFQINYPLNFTKISTKIIWLNFCNSCLYYVLVLPQELQRHARFAFPEKRKPSKHFI